LYPLKHIIEADGNPAQAIETNSYQMQAGADAIDELLQRLFS